MRSMSNSGPGWPSNSASGGALFGERTTIDREMFDAVIDALLDGSPPVRIEVARKLAETAPGWWSGPTLHRVRDKDDDGA